MAKPDVCELKQIGQWCDLAKYYLDEKTGVVWSHQTGSGNGLVCCGEVGHFRRTFKHRFRGELFPD